MKLTDKHKSNLLKLATEVQRTKVIIDMENFFSETVSNRKYSCGLSNKKELSEMVHECGTSCCLQGLAAITEGLGIVDDEDQASHCERVFGVSCMNGQAWSYIFGPSNTNDIAHAIIRLKLVASIDDITGLSLDNFKRLEAEGVYS